jgi:transposase
MSKPLSVDLRERVVAAVDGEMSRRKAAERFGVSISSAGLAMCGPGGSAATSARPASRPMPQ